jgi:ATP-binding cassette subfamily F protein uup
LENLLGEYSGTLLLVSHDRAFLNNVVTQTLVFEPEGVVKEYAGGYDDWFRTRGAVDQVCVTAPVVEKPAVGSPPTTTTKARPLNYKERREMEELPGQIEQWEAEQEALQQRMSEPGYYQQDGAEIARLARELEALHERLATAYERWETLEGLANGGK